MNQQPSPCKEGLSPSVGARFGSSSTHHAGGAVHGVVGVRGKCGKIIGVGNAGAWCLSCRTVAFIKLGAADYN